MIFKLGKDLTGLGDLLDLKGTNEKVIRAHRSYRPFKHPNTFCSNFNKI